MRPGAGAGRERGMNYWYIGISATNYPESFEGPQWQCQCLSRHTTPKDSSDTSSQHWETHLGSEMYPFPLLPAHWSESLPDSLKGTRIGKWSLSLHSHFPGTTLAYNWGTPIFYGQLALFDKLLFQNLSFVLLIYRIPGHWDMSWIFFPKSFPLYFPWVCLILLVLSTALNLSKIV